MSRLTGCAARPRSLLSVMTQSLWLPFQHIWYWLGGNLYGDDVQIAIGDRIDQRQLLADLVAQQYKRRDMDFIRGSFRVQTTIELSRHAEDQAWRITMFGDEVEQITEFDPLTGKKTGELKSVKIYANSHYVTPRPTLNQAAKSIKEELKHRLKS